MDISYSVLPSEQELNLIRYPVLLLNESRVIVGKNKSSHVFPIRKNSKIDHILFSADVRRMTEMQIGAVIRISVNVSDIYLAFVKRVADGYFVALRPITAQIWKKLESVSSSLPLSERDVFCQIEASAGKKSEPNESEKILAKNYNMTMRFRLLLARFLAVKAGAKPKAEHYELGASVLSMITTGCKELLRRNYKIHTSVSSTPCYADIDINTFCCTVALLFSVVGEIAFDRRFNIGTVGLDDEFALTFDFEPVMDEELYEGLLSGTYNGDLLSGSFGDVFFDLALVQMLCDVNGWEYRISKEDYSGILHLTLAVPTASDGTMQVNCPPNNDEMMQYMLAPLL